MPLGISHDLRRSRRFAKPKTAQSGLPGGPPEGGLRKSARPGGKGLVGKNHEAPSTPWTGRANRSRPPVEVFSPGGGGRPTGRPIGPPHPAEAGQSPWEKGSPSRCFLRAMPFPPGHDPGIPDMSNLMSPPAEPGVYLKEITRGRRTAGRRENQSGGAGASRSIGLTPKNYPPRLCS